MNPHMVRGQQLLERKRHKDAERELRLSIAEMPEDPVSHSLLAVALAGQNRWPEAIAEARAGVSLAPNLAYGHYALAAILLDADRTSEAQQAISEALRLEPDEPDYYDLLAAIHVRKQQWQEALNAALEGLRIDPDHVGCANMRAIALVKMGRKNEVSEAIDAVLVRDPENATSHATQGWALLHRNQPKEAMVYFREALRLDPNLEWAQAGIIEALKAHNIIYRLILQYFLWMSRLSLRARWGVILGGYLGYRLVILLQRSIPDLRPFLIPVGVLYIGFVFLTWTARPLSDLLLRFHPFGRLALPKNNLIAANWVGLCLLVSAMAFVGVVSLPATWGKDAFGIFALQSLAMVVPVAGAFRAPGRQNQRILTAYTVGLALLAVIDFVSALLGNRNVLLTTIFFIGWIAYSWVANIIISREQL